MECHKNIIILSIAQILPKDRLSLKKRHRLRLVKRLISSNKKDPTPKRDRVVVEVPPAGGDTTGGSNNNSPPGRRVNYAGLGKSVLFLDVFGSLFALRAELSVDLNDFAGIVLVVVKSH